MVTPSSIPNGVPQGNEVEAIDRSQRYAATPGELQARPQWLCWRTEWRNGKRTRVPVNPRTGRLAKVDDPTTWGTFEEAQAAASRLQCDGVGCVFTADDPYCGRDIDKCRDPETGETEAWAAKIVERMNSYTEVSPSGTGLHIIVRGKLPPGPRRKGRVEFYDQGRYFTMTGDVVTAVEFER